MVIPWLLVPVCVATLADEPTPSALEQLDPPRRAMVVMALLGIVLTGVVLVACVMIGGRWVRRLGRSDLGPSSAIGADRQRLRTRLTPNLPEAKTDETVSIDRPTDETRAGN